MRHQNRGDTSRQMQRSILLMVYFATEPISNLLSTYDTIDYDSVRDITSTGDEFHSFLAV